MSDPAIQLYCTNAHPMMRGADWCGECGEPPAKPRAPTDSAGRPITVGDVVRWRGHLYTIRSFGPSTGRVGTLSIAFEELLHVEEIPDEIGVDLVEKAADKRERLDRAFERLEADPEHAQRIAEVFDEDGKPRGLRLHEIEQALGEELAPAAASPTRCRWCGGDCPRWGNDVCPFRPRQIPRTTTEEK
jgi:hypothetical protein